MTIVGKGVGGVVGVGIGGRVGVWVGVLVGMMGIRVAVGVGTLRAVVFEGVMGEGVGVRVVNE